MTQENQRMESETTTSDSLGLNPLNLPIGSGVAEASMVLDSFAVPPHSKTQSTLAPTAEFTRLFLLAWIMRYVFRGFYGEVFGRRAPDFIKKRVNWFIEKTFLPRIIRNLEHELNHDPAIVASVKADSTDLHLDGKDKAGDLYRRLRRHIRLWRSNSSEEIPEIIKSATRDGTGKLVIEKGSEAYNRLRNVVRDALYPMFYSASLAAGSAGLTWSYSRLVHNDIVNIFREAVAYEKGIPQEKVTFNDIATSNNQIIQFTVKNYRRKMWQRFGTDAFLLAGVPTRSDRVLDFFLGVKGVQVFNDSWNRKTTMFEDLVGLINNKINPRNGLGQPIAVGEVFDLYQHYCDQFNPGAMFSNVVADDSTETIKWSRSRAIFQRVADLMNHTYAYKHQVKIDPTTGQPERSQDFALPKFVFLLGHNLIDPNRPDQTLARVEIANTYGIPAVKEMQAMLNNGAPLSAVLQRYPVPNLHGIASETVAERSNTTAQPSSRILASSAAAEKVTSSQHTSRIPIL